MKNLYDISKFVDVKTVEQTVCDLVNRFRKRRKEAGYTQKELARRTNVSYASIRRFETTGEISFVSLVNLASALDLLDDFYSLFKNPIVKDIRENEE